MDISQIKNADFTDDTEPRDEQLMTLLGQAYRGEITCTMAIANIEIIQPYSDFVATPSEEFRHYFIQKAQEGTPPPLHVYAKDGSLIMSDDYNSFALYEELGFSEVACIVIGETPSIDGVTYHGDPFRLELPSVEVLPVS